MYWGKVDSSTTDWLVCFGSLFYFCFSTQNFTIHILYESKSGLIIFMSYRLCLRLIQITVKLVEFSSDFKSP